MRHHQGKAFSMKTERGPGFGMLYGLVVACGLAVIGLALYRVVHDQTPGTWILLALLAGVTGSFSLKIPGMNGRVSAGDTIVFLSILMFGPFVGAIAAAVDAVLGSLRCKSSSRRLKFALYNSGNAALSAFVVGQAILHLPGSRTLHPASLVMQLCIMSGAYYLINTTLVAAAVALEKSLNIIDVWREGFMWTCANYLVGAFMAGILAQASGTLSPVALGAIFFSCAGVYISCRAHVRLARSHAILESRQRIENPAA
jgi:uncharacterized membrane protein